MASFQHIRDTADDDEFQSSENNDLVNLPEGEFWLLWKAWFRQAQRFNHLDQHVFSHGVLLVEPGYEHLESEVIHGVL